MHCKCKLVLFRVWAAGEESGGGDNMKMSRRGVWEKRDKVKYEIKWGEVIGKFFFIRTWQNERILLDIFVKTFYSVCMVIFIFRALYLMRITFAILPITRALYEFLILSFCYVSSRLYILEILIFITSAT
jgi:hypothetical protein